MKRNPHVTPGRTGKVVATDTLIFLGQILDAVRLANLSMLPVHLGRLGMHHAVRCRLRVSAPAQAPPCCRANVRAVAPIRPRLELRPWRHLHPSPFILHPSSFILHPSPFTRRTDASVSQRQRAVENDRLDARLARARRWALEHGRNRVIDRSLSER